MMRPITRNAKKPSAREHAKEAVMVAVRNGRRLRDLGAGFTIDGDEITPPINPRIINDLWREGRLHVTRETHGRMSAQPPAIVASKMPQLSDAA